MANTFRPYTIFENGLYFETVIEQSHNVRLVACHTGGDINLYRIEYGDNGTFQSHKVDYFYGDALSVYLSLVRIYR